MKNETKLINRIRIAKFIQANKQVSRRDIAASLGYSMPTVFSNVTELMDMGLLCEDGEYGSTGGRKSKVLAIRKGFRYVVGLDITRRHLRLLLIDLSGDILAEEYHRFPYEDKVEYYRGVGQYLEDFLDRNGCSRDKLIGVGISVPGFVSAEQDLLLHSDVLNVQNVSLKRFRMHIPYNIIMDNDANCAAYAEVSRKDTTAYVFLSNVVGGAIYVDGKLSEGERHKSGEFGHMIIHRGGRKCYCGKRGCMDAYCSASALQEQDLHLEDFFDRLESGDTDTRKRWEEFLDDLALAVSNIRMALDCKIILGGYLGSFIQKYLEDLAENIRKYNGFDVDMSYVTTGKYERLSSAIGAAQMMIDRYLDQL